MTNQTTDTINLLLQLGKIGTRVQLLRDNGALIADQLFFKSLQERKLTWSEKRKSIVISPYVLVLPGKITGLLSVAPSVEEIPPELCLGIVSKHHVLEIIFQNSRDRSIWSQGLSLLAVSHRPCLKIAKPHSASHVPYYLDEDIYATYDTHPAASHDIIQWTDIANDEQLNIQTFYSFLSLSYNGAVFLQYTQKRLQLPQKVLLKLDKNGKELQCIDENNEIVFQMPFDAEIQIIDPRRYASSEEKKESGVEMDETQTQSKMYFRYAPNSVYCFSIVHKTQSLHLGCYDKEQYKIWRDGLEYLGDTIHHALRSKVRKAVLCGDFMLSPSKQLIESPSKHQPSHHNREHSSSRSKSSGFWGSLFY